MKRAFRMGTKATVGHKPCKPGKDKECCAPDEASCPVSEIATCSVSSLIDRLLLETKYNNHMHTPNDRPLQLQEVQCAARMIARCPACAAPCRRQRRRRRRQRERRRRRRRRRRRAPRLRFHPPPRRFHPPPRLRFHPPLRPDRESLTIFAWVKAVCAFSTQASIQNLPQQLDNIYI